MTDNNQKFKRASGLRLFLGSWAFVAAYRLLKYKWHPVFVRGNNVGILVTLAPTIEFLSLRLKAALEILEKLEDEAAKNISAGPVVPKGSIGSIPDKGRIIL